jgi:hypothetical protein
MQVVPGINIPTQRTREQAVGERFSPFGRADRRSLELSGDDLARLRGAPQPLRVLVPVTIEA